MQTTNAFLALYSIHYTGAPLEPSGSELHQFGTVAVQVSDVAPESFIL